MKRASVTIDDEIEHALASYTRDQDVPPRLVDVVTAALREYLAGRGYVPPATGHKPQGVPRSRAARIEGPDTLAAAVIADRR